ncbi:MAG: tetratricopeptide repeat protein, partial [Melioribacteraceae bacterium]
LLVVRAKPTGRIWEDRLVDLRVEDSTEPLKELRRLINVHTAYGHMNNGDLAIERNDMAKAMEEYSSAMKMFPKNLEMKYWTAITLANKGKLDEALPMLKDIFKKDKNWKTLTERLVPVGLLTVSEEDLKKILK